jgi:hypothetical protein
MTKEIKKKRRNKKQTKTQRKTTNYIKEKGGEQVDRERNTKEVKNQNRTKQETRVETTQKRTLESNNLLRTKCP